MFQKKRADPFLGDTARLNSGKFVSPPVNDASRPPATVPESLLQSPVSDDDDSIDSWSFKYNKQVQSLPPKSKSLKLECA